MIRIAASWGLYALGDVWSRVAVERGLGNWFGWPYRWYNSIMTASHLLQGDDKCGPWGQKEELT